MKLSTVQREVLEKLRDGWTLRTIHTANGFDRLWLCCPERRVVLDATYAALVSRGLISKQTYEITDAGREVLR